MAEINAKIIIRNNTQLTLSANRKGGCANCEKSSHCGVLFLSDDKDKTLLINAESRHSLSEEYQQGDEVSLYCDDNALLMYISIIFIPTLCCLLLMTFMVESLLSNWSVSTQIATQLVISFVVGALISRKLLQGFSAKGSPLKLSE